jgi:hypothetical protein
MKKLTAGLVCLLAFGFASTAIAARPGKANILHCGCAVDEAGNLGMAYIDVNVSSKARGHNKHGAGTIDSCFDGVDTSIDFIRTADDCQLAGTQLGNLSACETISASAGDLCGELAPQ